MNPQPYPLYARIWTTNTPTPTTAAIIGWTQDPDWHPPIDRNRT